jgi:hypothetical protein
MGLGFFKKFFDGMKNIGTKIKVGLFGDGIDDSQPPDPYHPSGKQGFLNSDFVQKVVKPIAAETFNQGVQNWVNKTPIPTTSDGSLTSNFVNSDLVQKTVKPMIGNIVDQGIHQWLKPPEVPQYRPQPTQNYDRRQQTQRTEKYVQPTQNYDQRQPTLSYDQPPSRGRKLRDKREVLTPILRD